MIWEIVGYLSLCLRPSNSGETNLPHFVCFLVKHCSSGTNVREKQKDNRILICTLKEDANTSGS